MISIINFLQKILQFILKNWKAFTILAIILVIYFLFVAPIVASASQKIDDYFFREDIENLIKNPIEDKSSAEIAADGFKSFGYDLTDEEIEELTIEENVEKANEIAKYLDVYDYQYDFYTEFKLDDYELTNTELTYDGRFMQYDFSSKWRDFFGLSIFGPSFFDVKFRADVYAKGSDFPLNYKEEEFFEFSVENKALQTWDLHFEGGMQLVLPDKNQDNMADDIDLIMVVQITSKSNEGDTYSKVFEVPLQVRNGEIQ